MSSRTEESVSSLVFPTSALFKHFRGKSLAGWLLKQGASCIRVNDRAVGEHKREKLCLLRNSLMEPHNSEKCSLGKIALYPKSLLNVLQYQNKSHDTLDRKTKLISSDFTFLLPCIVTDFFLNKQPDALIIQIYSVIKLYMFQAFSVTFIRSSLLYIRHW